jgi:hypothetical protein
VLVYLAGETDLMGHEDHVVRTSKTITHRLLSYFYHGMKVAGNKPSKEALWGKAERQWHMFLDSGAFTAWTKKKAITCEQFAEFIHNSGNTWDVISSLDAIGDADQSYKNFHRLLKLGCNVRPVHHYGEPDEYLHRYLEEGHDYIFIGGMVGRPRQQLEAWLHHVWPIMSDADGLPLAKFHGFGLTDMHLSTKFPWYSIDSSSWIMTGNFGAGMFWIDDNPVKVSFSVDARSKDAQNIRSTHVDNLPPMQRAVVDRCLAELGITREDAAHYLYRNVINANFFSQLSSKGCTHYRHQAMELPWN